MIATLFTGFLTPLKLYPYTYLVLTMLGKTTYFIAEHQPTILANLPMATIYLLAIVGIPMFTKVKIKLSDLFLMFGLVTLSIMSQRQISLLFVLTAFIVTKMIVDVVKNNYKKELKVDITK